MTALFWSQLMKQLLEIFKGERPSGSILIIVALLAVAAYAWADQEFVKRDEFVGLQKMVMEGFESIEINDSMQTIRGIKLEILITKAADGSDLELSRLNEELAQAKDYKYCLINEKPNCKYMKEVE